MSNPTIFISQHLCIYIQLVIQFSLQSIQKFSFLSYSEQKQQIIINRNLRVFYHILVMIVNYNVINVRQQIYNHIQTQLFCLKCQQQLIKFILQNNTVCLQEKFVFVMNLLQKFILKYFYKICFCYESPLKIHSQIFLQKQLFNQYKQQFHKLALSHTIYLTIKSNEQQKTSDQFSFRRFSGYVKNNNTCLNNYIFKQN
eukprot:TRINITY_DN970_c0_g1_i4.p2 TRINITY_DN970_c0_g1~~TRINITY_DN970_c0_g1_i4.p2  ORF type:complete len:199 (+),score=-27.34 TRINITY_DN970_c0_g1_i4:347-943(+)